LSFYSFLAEFDDQDGSVSYTFTAKTGTDYRVYFYPAKDYSDYVVPYRFLSEFGFICGITKVAPNEFKIEPFDVCIKETVKQIFIDFIHQFGDKVILLYHCDYHDGRQHKRNSLFRQWHSEVKERIAIYMEDTEISTVNADGNPILTNYLGFFILEVNPNKEAIKAEFHCVKSDLIREK
jgi:hypothetical protein